MLLENCLVEKWRDQLSRRSIVSIISKMVGMGRNGCKKILQTGYFPTMSSPQALTTANNVKSTCLLNLQLRIISNLVGILIRNCYPTS